MEFLLIPLFMWLREFRRNIRNGVLDFWKLVRDRPEEAAAFFRTSPYWHIEQMPPGRKLSGPYKYFDPFLGRTTKVYADEEHIEASQAEFVSRVRRAR